MRLNDILFVLFRHKLKLAFGLLLGAIGAGVVYFFVPHESQAKLLVRYVVDRSAVDRLDSQTKDVAAPNASAINAG